MLLSAPKRSAASMRTLELFEDWDFLIRQAGRAVSGTPQLSPMSIGTALGYAKAAEAHW
jgi:hypothetical protein